MTVQTGVTNSYHGGSDSGIGEDSLDLRNKTAFVKKVGQVVSIAAPGEEIAGVNNTTEEFAADNQTVARQRVEFAPAKLCKEYIVTISGGAVTAADEGSFFDVTATGDEVDGATMGATGQLELTRFISGTQSGFQIANT